MDTAQGRRRSKLAVEWIYIRYRTILLAVLLVVLAAAGAIWWRAAHAGVTEEQAGRAVAAAALVVQDAATAAPTSEDVVAAQRALEEARADLAARSYAPAVDKAGDAERRARAVLGGHRSDSGVRLARVDGEVRVKRAGQFLWENASERDELRPGDQVRTGNGGSAQLVYFDGSMVAVSPGTLIEVHEMVRDPARRTQRVSERLAFGQVSAQTQDVAGYDTVHEVATESAAVRADKASEFRVRHDKDTNRSEVVASRGAVVVAAAGRETTLEESTRATVAPGGIVERSALLEQPRLSSPADQETFVLPGQSVVALRWTPVPQARGYLVQFADRPLVAEDDAADRRVGAPELRLTRLDPGSYFWRVSAVDERSHGGRWSETRRFRVVNEGFKDSADRTPPELQIVEIMVVGTNAIVSGRTEPGAVLWVEGERVDVGEDGRFTWVVKLHQDGKNLIHFVAQDAAGNETRKMGTAYVDAL